MAGFAPNPEVVILGTVASVSEREFDGKPKGRAVGVFTRTGFIEVRVPVALDELAFQEGQPVALACDLNNWSMPDENTGHTKTGLTITLRRLVAADEVTAATGVLVATK